MSYHSSTTLQPESDRVPRPRDHRAKIALFSRLTTAATIALLGLYYFATCPLALAQRTFGSADRFQLSETVRLDEVDGQLRHRLARLDEYLASRQWDEAVEAIREVIAAGDDQVVRIDDEIAVNLRQYCHVQIASFPPEALALYRSRVDPLAEQWYKTAIENVDADLLNRVVDQMFCSSWGDDALLALGEMSLEKGQFAAARRYWQCIDRDCLTDDGLPNWLKTVNKESPDGSDESTDSAEENADGKAIVLAYPDSNLPMADVHARLVLASIFEGALPRATAEWQWFRRLHPQAEGKLGGVRGNYAKLLKNILDASRGWPAEGAQRDWPTFAGSFRRTTQLPPVESIGGRAWSHDLKLTETVTADIPIGRRRIAEDADHLLSFHPVVVDDLLLLNDSRHVQAFRLRDGKPAWGRADGVIFRPSDSTENRSSVHLGDQLGVARFTMTAADGKLYARMGSPVTARAAVGPTDGAGGYLICLDLRRQGAKVWQASPDDARWAFEGSPVCYRGSVYVGMRRSDVMPHAYVACYDAETGQRRWLRRICAADTPARSEVEEITYNLLTLADDTLFYNTNLGAVAALATDGGSLRWISLYSRAKSDDTSRRAAHFYRDLNPCVCHQGIVYVAPADSDQILALDATTGRRLWATSLPSDVVQLLGVQGGNLIASGDYLWWIDAVTGKAVRRWPDGGGAPRGFGRGIIAGNEVFWPTRDEIRVFECRTTEQTREPIRLTPHGASGGNLLLVDGYLLIATSDTLYAFGPKLEVSEPAGPGLTRHRLDLPELTHVAYTPTEPIPVGDR